LLQEKFAVLRIINTRCNLYIYSKTTTAAILVLKAFADVAKHL